MGATDVAATTGRFVWYELLSKEQDAAKRFYTHVFGWGTQAFGDGTAPYFLWTADDAALGGCMKLLDEYQRAGMRPHWWAYVAVEDVDLCAEHAVKLGAKVATPPTDIPDVGRFAIITDPQGATIGLLRSRRPNAPSHFMETGFVAWHELHTTDADGSWTFYSQLFGWESGKSLDMGEAGSYRMFEPAGAPVEAMMGGIFPAPEGGKIPTRWLYYVRVADLDATLTRIADGGGEVRHGPMEVPGGRAAQCADPEGSAFGVFALAD